MRTSIGVATPRREASRPQGIDDFFEFSLLGLLTSGYLAVAGSGYLDYPTMLLTALALMIRAVFVARRWSLEVSTLQVNAVTLGYVGFYPLDYVYFSKDFLTATVHLVFFLAITKILTARTARDYFYIKVIAFLELLSASILSASANYFFFLAAFVFFGVATFAASEIWRSSEKANTIVRGVELRMAPRLAALTVFSVFGILLLTATLFIILPRTAHAAILRFLPQRDVLPGFSGEVNLGQIGELKMRSTAVMHVHIDNETRPLALKWRGSALTHFDGKRWFNTTEFADMLNVGENGILRVVTVEDTLRIGERISYEVVMQEGGADALFVAGSPEMMRIFVPVVIRTPGNTFRLGFRTPNRLRYSVHSLLEKDGDPRYMGEALSPESRLDHLELPPLDPRVFELTRDVLRYTIDPSARARQIERYLRRTYRYTTELPQVESRDPIADFLFRRRMGHCEYFASAMAVMLRAAGIPSRVVTGFQSGLFNPISGWYLIRASDAHSWVEAWLPGKGWTTFDPTPPDPNPPSFSLATRLQLYVDAFQVYWQDWVLGYDIERQLSLAAQMEQSSRTLSFRWLDEPVRVFFDGTSELIAWAKRYGPLAVFAVAVFWLVALFGRRLWRGWLAAGHARRVERGEASASDATLLYQRLLAVLHRRGFEKPLWLTPIEFARKLPPGAAAAAVLEFTASYNDLRFGGRPEAAKELLRLLDMVEQIPLRGSPAEAAIQPEGLR